jgi:6-phosphogluconolactonase
VTGPSFLADVRVASPGDLAETLADIVLGEARRAWSEHRGFALALPGGSVATHFFPRLARMPVDWSRVEFFWGDERAVPPDDPRSNYAAARALWLDPAGVPDASVHPMRADAADLAGAAAEYEALLRSRAAPCLDLVLLGVGPDGHVCSLFPGRPALEEEQRLVVPEDDAPKPPRRRLTLTLPMIAGASHVVVAALGEEKAPALHRSVDERDPELPLARVLDAAPRALLLLDPPAASLLDRRPTPAAG